MNSAIYQYYPTRNQCLSCIVCGYSYRLDAPLSTLQKHLRVKHNFSIRKPLSPNSLQRAIEDAQSIPQPITHPLTPTSLGNSREACLEDALVTWFNKEGYSTEIINQTTFRNLFYTIDPTITLPSQERLDNLLNSRLNQAANDVYRSYQPPPLAVSSLIHNTDSTSYQVLPPISELNIPSRTSLQHLLHPPSPNPPS